MNPDLVNGTYEAIDNPILRLMLYFLAAAVIALSGALVYLFKKYIALTEESIRVLNDLNTSLDKMADHIQQPR